MDAMTMKIDAQYKDFQSRSKQSNLDDDDIPMSREEEAKFMQTFCRTHFYNDYRDRDSNRDNWRSSERNDYNRDNYQSHSDDKPDLQKQLSNFIKAQYSTNSCVKDTFMDLKNKLETTTKNQQALIQNLKAKFDRLADKQSGRPSGSLPSNTQPNLKDNPNDQQNDSETPINFDSDNEDDEPTPKPKPKTPKPVKETLIPKPYKPKIPYPQCLRKEKMEAQYGKFLDMIRAVRINVPLVDVLAGMPNYGKFLKEIPTKMSVRLANRSFQYPVGIAENMLVEVGKFTFPADFVILEMEKDSKVPLILGQLFLHTADAVIRVKQK
ncbi:reverse transcriptase domain-containing protein [Tanacetum coccineum]